MAKKPEELVLFARKWIVKYYTHNSSYTCYSFDSRKELISRVHNDKRMRLFEYQISYTEL